jgi:2-polyprenyl-3-methyl-5-hydroxy-6-metoxy-1,4-benzoquinol methylase
VKHPLLIRHELGFLEVRDKPSRADLQAFYAERYYQTERSNYRRSYSEDELRFIRLKIAQRAALVDLYRGSLAQGSMLDVGCGEGFALAWFHANGWNVEGIDFSSAGIEHMNPNLAPMVQTGDVFGLLDERIEQGRKFELVWLTNVLEHVLAPIDLLISLRKLMAPDGMMVVTVPNDGSAFQQELLDSGDISEPFWVAIPDHLSYFTYDGLVNIAAATGWECRDIVADFPIDWFLLHDGSNYVRDRGKGPAAHQARIRMELLIGQQPHQRANDFFREMAKVGLGRGLTTFLSPAGIKPGEAP